jgi:hypothetical protein
MAPYELPISNRHDIITYLSDALRAGLGKFIPFNTLLIGFDLKFVKTCDYGHRKSSGWNDWLFFHGCGG